MKGPGFRLDLDVRRVWECPACGRRLKLAGDVTRVACDCAGEASPAMRLVERLRRTDSPFDHVGFAAQKRIDAALRKPHGPPLPESDEERESVPETIAGSDAASRPPESALPETTHAIDAGAGSGEAGERVTGGSDVATAPAPAPTAERPAPDAAPAPPATSPDHGRP